MKKLILTLLVAAIGTTAMVAQNSENSKRKDHTSVFDKLKLSDEQKQQIKDIKEDFAVKMKETKESLDNLRKEEMEKIQSVLTDEQKEQWKQQGKDFARKQWKNGRKHWKHFKEKVSNEVECVKAKAKE